MSSYQLTPDDLDISTETTPAIRAARNPNLPGQRFRSTKALTALEVAAACGQEQMFDLIRDARADESAWTQTQSPGEIVDDGLLSQEAAVPSSLSTSSPVHKSIAAGHHAMLQKLLHQHHDPKTRECITELRDHPDLDPYLRTPVFGVHLLHFAVACHSSAPLSWLGLPLSSAGSTAFGQTLLHIASLPLTFECIYQNNPDVVRSIHRTRTLDLAWSPHPRPSPLHMEPRLPSRLNPLRPRGRTPMTSAEQEAQLDTLRVIVDAGIDVRAQDVDGNTALHYLAETLNVDPGVMQLFIDMDAGEEVYHLALNREGLSPRALWESRSSSNQVMEE
ncbi:uncharacterized protein BDW47DRAFT_122700 [Aspergillus candidus]|uniref:Uncharacterized protein n=1 Tax=Aspergillus candidus TaxID=41067 RepID=A0A2I2FM04_ASPCN|nr:hypothetical protein BDW47DRAFT_122700 [Aspergillus candidus]PLB41665.1 hypothetical protein BDW47DRAFT_122700 [Aspergillus candidus]